MKNKTKEHLASEHCDNLDIIGEDYNYNSFTSGYDSRQPEIDALKEEIPKWISVEDRLPTPNQVVLIFWDNKITSGSYKNFHNGYFQHGSATQLKVTHWQPLPDPPKQTKP